MQRPRNISVSHHVIIPCNHVSMTCWCMYQIYRRLLEEHDKKAFHPVSFSGRHMFSPSGSKSRICNCCFTDLTIFYHDRQSLLLTGFSSSWSSSKFDIRLH